MSVNKTKQIPDYELDDLVVITEPDQLRAIACDLRSSILHLLHERARRLCPIALVLSVRPKAPLPTTWSCSRTPGCCAVVRTRRVRAIDERYYGRVARTIYIGALTRGTRT